MAAIQDRRVFCGTAVSRFLRQTLFAKMGGAESGDDPDADFDDCVLAAWDAEDQVYYQSVHGGWD